MNSYLNIIPIELFNIIQLYLDIDDLENIEELFAINYETLFRIEYGLLYSLMKKVLIYDKKLGRYEDWKIFYFDMNTYDSEDIIESFTGKYFSLITLSDILWMSSSTFNTIYSALLLYKYPKFYELIYHFNGILKSHFHSYYIYKIVNLFSNKNAKYNENIQSFFITGDKSNLDGVTSNDILLLSQNGFTDNDLIILTIIIHYYKQDKFIETEWYELMNNFNTIEDYDKIEESYFNALYYNYDF